jgi:hypothetical protein
MSEDPENSYDEKDESDPEDYKTSFKGKPLNKDTNNKRKNDTKTSDSEESDESYYGDNLKGA